VALEAALALAKSVIILNPTTPIGAGDLNPRPRAASFVDFLNKKFPRLRRHRPQPRRRRRKSPHPRRRPQPRHRPPRRALHPRRRNLTLKQISKDVRHRRLPSPSMKVPHSVAMVFAFFDEIIAGPPPLAKNPRHRRSGPHGQKENVRSPPKPSANSASASSPLPGAPLRYRLVSRTPLRAHVTPVMLPLCDPGYVI